jgi:hypothetical protein
MALSSQLRVCSSASLSPKCARSWNPLAVTGRLERTSICDLEVGFSARKAEEWDHLAADLGAFDVVDTTSTHMRRALEVQRSLAQRS